MRLFFAIMFLSFNCMAAGYHVSTTSVAVWNELDTKIKQLRCKKLMAEHDALEAATGLSMPQHRKWKRIECIKFKNAKDSL